MATKISLTKELDPIQNCMHKCTFKLLTYGTVLKVLILYKNNPVGQHLKTRQFISIKVINNH